MIGVGGLTIPTALPPSFRPNLHSFKLTLLRRRRAVRITAQNTSGSDEQQQQQLNLSVLRFTLGIPGLDESYLPRYIGVVFGGLIVLNHLFSPATPSAAQLRSEALGLGLAAFSTALPYLGKFLKGSNQVNRVSLPEGNKQIFVLSENLPDTEKEDLAWGSYVLLRNTNTMSVIVMVQDGVCIRGYWNVPEDFAQADMVDWFKSNIENLGFMKLQDELYFPKISDSQIQDFLPKGTFSLLVHPISVTADTVDDMRSKTIGLVLLASSASYAYSDRDRAWIGAVANKYKGAISESLQNPSSAK